MRRTLPAAALALALVLVPAACSSKGDRPPPAPAGLEARTVDQILVATRQAFRSARSVRLRGRLVQEHQPVTVDVRITGDDRARGWLTRGDARLWLVRIGDRLWLRGERFWRATLGEALADRIGDRWVRAPAPVAGDSAGGLHALTDVDGVVEQLLSPSPGSRIVKGPVGSVGGVPAIRLDHPGDGSSLYVATRGPPYPLRILPRQEPGRPGQVLDFGEYNRPVTITAPSDALRLSPGTSP